MRIYTRLLNGGWQTRYRFDNGYGLSVVNHDYSYTDGDDECEIAVTKYSGDGIDDCELDYTTPVTSDVIAHVPQDELEKYIKTVMSLKEVS